MTVSYGSTLLLLIAALVCLGSWPNTFKAAKWRFQLFSIDFGLGGIIVAVVAAYTLGAFGGDVGFSDRMLLAGRTAQVFAVGAGAAFSAGIMLMLAGVSLLGMATAVPLTVGVALMLNSFLHYRHSNILYLVGGAILMLVSVVFEMRAARLAGMLERKRVLAQPAPSAQDPHPPAAKPPTAAVSGPAIRAAKKRVAAVKRKPPRAARGIICAIVAGLALAFFVPFLDNSLPGEFGLGPYAGMLLFALGALGSAIVYDFFFLNIGVDGPTLNFAGYVRGKLSQHLLALVGGVVCFAGLLAAILADESPRTLGVAPSLYVLLPLLSVPLAVLFGLFIWKETSAAPASKNALLIGLLLFLCSLGLFAFGFTL